jgi:hypothetical protein
MTRHFDLSYTGGAAVQAPGLICVQDYPITECSARQVSLLVSALPALQHLEITVLRRSRLARYWPGLGPIPDGDTSVIFSLQGGHS